LGYVFVDTENPGPKRVVREIRKLDGVVRADAHARASHATVSVDLDGDTVTAEIADDGIGGADTTSGSGLRGLVYRLDALGGTLSIDSPRGGPTSIRARVPSIPT
jgi:glucose-6-phosphate-specific signal transduction histidine kinase